ncbi:NADH-ubiquinone oxidoreductase [Grosmannia clavigera kw1407]|uniref:NADH-ubiquinone oxidoreductase n=1 Tax=Grosmannia clavigera (strain kw1407 / UAMH 11150) TaxID=655863 RepID=F0XRN8_GROCL|nr:NADH-ubiquinone oxidoreductase [Grosmannia clavigera kw1407]EFW99523.1 NADH-ubiquinone oxidoreductase [Grosmannia clavigera kw1407]
MLPLRQRAACMARQARLRPVMPASRASRAFASTDSHSHDHHDHHDRHDSHASVDEPMGKGFYVALAAIPATWILYTLKNSGKDGQPTALESYFSKFDYLTEQWEVRNTLRTAAIEQATHDRILLQTVPRNSQVDLRFPEVFQSGSPYNVPAGHAVNLNHVVAHYKDQHYKETERQAKAAAKE